MQNKQNNFTSRACKELSEVYPDISFYTDGKTICAMRENFRDFPFSLTEEFIKNSSNNPDKGIEDIKEIIDTLTEVREENLNNFSSSLTPSDLRVIIRPKGSVKDSRVYKRKFLDFDVMFYNLNPSVKLCVEHAFLTKKAASFLKKKFNMTDEDILKEAVENSFKEENNQIGRITMNTGAGISVEGYMVKSEFGGGEFFLKNEFLQKMCDKNELDYLILYPFSNLSWAILEVDYLEDLFAVSSEFHYRNDVIREQDSPFTGFIVDKLYVYDYESDAVWGLDKYLNEMMFAFNKNIKA